MIKNKDMPALPYSNGIKTYPGLTKREYAAIKIMAGFAADPSVNQKVESNKEASELIERFAKSSIDWADALFNELDKTEG